jgi:hypothetical protein
MPAAVAAEVIAVVRAWAKAPVSDGDRVLKSGRLTLEPALWPVLVDEVAEITAEQLLVAIDMPHKVPPAADEKPVPFLGLELSQEQGRRALQWHEDQEGLAQALGLELEAWSKKLGEGFARTLAALQGKPISALAGAIANELGADPLKSAARGFQGAVDPATSEKAGLRGILAARNFKK